MQPTYHVHVARCPYPAELDAQGNDEHGSPIVDLDIWDIEAAIDAEDWCGCFTLRGDPAVVVIHGETLPAAAKRYLRQK